MKIKGQSIKPPKDVVVVIPRDGESIVFRAKAVLDQTPFDAICPEPQVPRKKSYGAKADLPAEPFPEEPNYVKALGEYHKHLQDWIFMESLSATEGLEWETVKPDQPDTWGNWQTELKAAGFSQLEIMRIFQAIIDANGLNQSRIDEATKSFLAGQDLPDQL